MPFCWRRDRTTCASRRSSTCTVPVCHDHSSALQALTGADLDGTMFSSKGVSAFDFTSETATMDGLPHVYTTALPFATMLYVQSLSTFMEARGGGGP